MGTVHQFLVQRNQTPEPAEELADALRPAIDAACIVKVNRLFRF